MLMLKILPVIAYLGGGIVNLIIASNHRTSPTVQWMLPATLGALFLTFSAVTIGKEGVLQFWVNQMTSFAGNQVWIDVVFAVTIAFYLIAPRARDVGMPLMPWAIAVIATACVAILPMLARVLWLEQKDSLPAS